MTGRAPMRDPIDDCVHCGFCLPACPTYVSWAEEMDSPRGRIYLMRGLRDGDIAWGPAVAEHFDRCLGCMACVTACPSGVRYDALIEATRAAREERAPRRLSEVVFRAVVFALFPHPWRLRLAGLLLWAWERTGLAALLRRSRLLERISPRLAQLEALAPRPPLAALMRGLPAGVAAEGEPRARVGLIAGCVQRVFFPEVNEATLRVLRKEGCETVVPEAQGCCGALSLHAGRLHEARAFARALMRAFDAADVDVVVVNAAGCGSTLKEYGRLFEGDPDWSERARIFSAKVRDVCEFLAGLPPRARRHPIAERAAVHDPCHLAHAQRIRRQPRELLAAIPGLTLCDVPGVESCCGSAGIYNLVQPESANEIGARKIEDVLRTGARVLVSANPGCTLHMQRLLRERGEPLKALHPIELLDRSLRGESLD